MIVASGLTRKGGYEFKERVFHILGEEGTRVRSGRRGPGCRGRAGHCYLSSTAPYVRSSATALSRCVCGDVRRLTSNSRAECGGFFDPDSAPKSAGEIRAVIRHSLVSVIVRVLGLSVASMINLICPVESGRRGTLRPLRGHRSARRSRGAQTQQILRALDGPGSAGRPSRCFIWRRGHRSRSASRASRAGPLRPASKRGNGPQAHGSARGGWPVPSGDCPGYPLSRSPVRPSW
jgi:hypothetical protein